MFQKTAPTGLLAGQRLKVATKAPRWSKQLGITRIASAFKFRVKKKRTHL
jgi:hypothetical protein